MKIGISKELNIIFGVLALFIIVYCIIISDWVFLSGFMVGGFVLDMMVVNNYDTKRKKLKR